MVLPEILDQRSQLLVGPDGLTFQTGTGDRHTVTLEELLKQSDPGYLILFAQLLVSHHLVAKQEEATRALVELASILRELVNQPRPVYDPEAMADRLIGKASSFVTAMMANQGKPPGA